MCYLDGDRMDIFLNACRREFSGLFNGVQTIHQIWTWGRAYFIYRTWVIILKLILKQYFNIHMTLKHNSPSYKVVNVMPFTRPCSELEKKYIYVSISDHKNVVWLQLYSSKWRECMQSYCRPIGENNTKSYYSPALCYLHRNGIDTFLNASWREISGPFNAVQTVHQLWKWGWAYFIYSTWVIISKLNPKLYFQMHMTWKLYPPTYWVVNAMPFTRPCSSLAD